MRLIFLVLLVLVQPNTFPKLVQDAQQAFQSGRYSEAATLLKQTLAVAPKDSVLWFYLGASEMKLKQPDLAMTAFQKALAFSPKMAPAYFNLALLYWRKGDVGKATDNYRRGLEIDPTDRNANQNYATLLLNTGKPREAIAPLQHLKAIQETNVPVRFSLIQAYLQSGEKSAGASELGSVLASGIATPAEEVQLATGLAENRAPDLAEKTLRDAVRRAPDLAQAHGSLGMLLLAGNHYEEAVQELGRAFQLDPKSSEYAMGVAEGLLLWKHNFTLIKFLHAIEPQFGKLPEFQFKLALAYYSAARYPKAIEKLDDLLKENPPRQDVIQYYLGNSYMAVDQYKNAEECFRRAIEINPQDSSYYESYATLLRKQGAARIPEAISLLEKAHELRPESPLPGLQMALCYNMLHEYAKARPLLESAVNKDPGLLPGHVALATVYFRLGLQDEAEKQQAIIHKLETREQEHKLQIMSEQ